MNRLEQHFADVKSRGDKAAIFFITAGDPSLDETLDIMLSMAQNGADCIELGMPFSDPIADGSVIQRSTARAMKHKVTISDILKLVARFREHSQTPVVMMGYLNPVMRYGIEMLVKDCAAHGVDGLIIADLPYEEGEEIEAITKAHDVSLIYLLAPDIDPKRTEAIARASAGFVYCVAQYSTTGVESDGDEDAVLPETITSLQRMTDLTVALGFGISSLEKAEKMSQVADGIIIGSWLIKELETATDKPKHAGAFVRNVKSAIKV
jgi:tryptophan synthase alpha chain